MCGQYGSVSNKRVRVWKQLKTVTLFWKLNWLRDIEASKQVDTEYAGNKDEFQRKECGCGNLQNGYTFLEIGLYAVH